MADASIDKCPEHCRCFKCTIQRDAKRRIDADELNWWELPGHYIELLVDLICETDDREVFLPRVNATFRALNAAIEKRVSPPAVTTAGPATILPFKPPTQR
jgi:hypothetical protein